MSTAVSERLAARVGVPVGRLKRMVGYGLVGLSGVAVDLAIVEGLSLAGAHYLLTVGVAYLTAMTWNFGLQRRLVYGSPAGSVLRQYLRYMTVDVGAFAVRVGVVVVTVDLASPWDALPYVPETIVPAVPASLLGIVLAFLIGFAGTETVVFGEVSDQ